MLNGREGWVTLRHLVNQTGNTLDLADEIYSGLNRGTFDKAAIATETEAFSSREWRLRTRIGADRPRCQASSVDHGSLVKDRAHRPVLSAGDLEVAAGVPRTNGVARPPFDSTLSSNHASERAERLF